MLLAKAHNLLLFVQEGGHEEVEEHAPEGIDLILPETAELLWGAVCFIVVLFLLTKFAFPKIREGIEKREQEIKGNLEGAEKAKAQAEKELEEYRKQLADAKAEGNRIIEDARGQAEEVRRELIAKAEKEAETIVTRAQEQLEQERSRTIQELHSTIGDMSIELAEKVVGRAIDASSQRELVDAYIREVSGMRNGGGSTN